MSLAPWGDIHLARRFRPTKRGIPVGYECWCGWTSSARTFDNRAWDAALKECNRHIADAAVEHLTETGELSRTAAHVFTRLLMSDWNGSLRQLLIAAEGVAS